MGWNQENSAAERVIESAAALSLSGAVAFAVVRLAPLAGPMLVGSAALGALAVAVGAWSLLRRIDRSRGETFAFAPVDFDAAADELLLDDPIAPAAADSRVVQMFGAEPLPAPGELVTRIADYLEAGRGAQPRPSEASVALHAALADIRRSLR